MIILAIMALRRWGKKLSGCGKKRGGEEREEGGREEGGGEGRVGAGSGASEDTASEILRRTFPVVPES